MIIDNPITLPYSKFINNSVTTLIFEVRKNQTLELSELQNSLVDAIRVGKVDAGKGIIFNFKVDFQKVNDLTRNGNPFDTELPNMVQETIIIDNYKVVEITTSYELSKDSDTNINDTLSWLQELLDDTRVNYLYDQTVALIKSWTPTKTSQTKTINWKDATAASDSQEAVFMRNDNAQTLLRLFADLKISMGIPSNKYSDVDEYEDVNDQTGATKGKVKTSVKESDLVFFVNSDVLNELKTAQINAFNPEMMEFDGVPVIVVPADSIADETFMGILCYKNKFALADFYTVGRSQVNGKTLMENQFLHFAYGMGVFKTAPAVKIKRTITRSLAAKAVAKAEAKAAKAAA